MVFNSLININFIVEPPREERMPFDLQKFASPDGGRLFY